MPTYGYQAVSKSGAKKKGSITATDLQHARLQLIAEGLTPIEIKEQNILNRDINISFLEGVKSRDLSVFCHQFVSVIDAGVPVAEALGLLGQQTQNKTLRKAIFGTQKELENGKLGVVLGEVPGEGVSASLFMVVAKTIIKSQLRVGMPLLEAITEANRQLFEVGQGMVVNAMVGVLDENGEFYYINAGQQLPLLMRSQDRYEWQNVPVYAPLGQNENVSYQVQQISLRQGDRLFFHTAGLGQITGREEELFAERRLQASLNASRSKHLNLNELLAQIHDDGKTFARQQRSVGGFALLALDYLRGRKDLAHCVVARDWSGSVELSNFLKRQLQENGFNPKDVAQVAVLADEIFALCCRQRTDRLITVECAVDRKQRLVTLNWKSTFGSNPLQVREGADTELAVNYILGAVQNVRFQQGEMQDLLTVVKQL